MTKRRCVKFEFNIIAWISIANVVCRSYSLFKSYLPRKNATIILLWWNQHYLILCSLQCTAFTLLASSFFRFNRIWLSFFLLVKAKTHTNNSRFSIVKWKVQQWKRGVMKPSVSEARENKPTRIITLFFLCYFSAWKAAIYNFQILVFKADVIPMEMCHHWSRILLNGLVVVRWFFLFLTISFWRRCVQPTKP